MSDRPSLPLSRRAPETPGLSARLTHHSGKPAISITDSPQVVDLAFTNRTPLPITAGPASLRLVFRKGVLDRPEQIALAPQSEAQWVLALELVDDEDIALTFVGVEAFMLRPGETHHIRLTGVSAAAAGGSRSTRVAMRFDNFFHPSGAEVAGTRLIHLPILRWHAPAALELRDILMGSIAQAGPFTAGFDTEPSLLNDGKTLNQRRLLIVNTTNTPVLLSDDEDAATRMTVGFHRSGPTDPWGLIRSHGDRLTVRCEAQGWDMNRHTLRRIRPGALRPNEAIALDLDIHSAATSGQTQLAVSVENLPDYDDLTLVLTLNLGASAEVDDAIHMVKPLELRGNRAALHLRSSEEGTGSQGLQKEVKINTNHSAEAWGRLDIDAPAGVRLNAGGASLDVGPDGSAELTGDLTVSGSISDKNGLVVPIGTIVMWSNYGGREIPEGWALCDGSGDPATPDLRGRFVVGHAPGGAANREDPGQTNQAFQSVGATGGEQFHTLNVNEMPHHDHGSRTHHDGNHYHHIPIHQDGLIKGGEDYPPGNGFMLHLGVFDALTQFPFPGLSFSLGRKAFEKQQHNGSPVADYGPTTSKTPSAHSHGITPSGGGQAHENRPPFYVLAYIIKVN